MMTGVHPQVGPDFLLSAYAHGIFPMAGEEGEIRWFAPDPRAIIPLDGFKTTRSLRSVYRRGQFECAVDRDFDAVIRACADRGEDTWISGEMIEAYCKLHRLGFAHSVEAWEGETLAGGLYGVSLGGAFFGESMFHRVTDASKVALVYLVERLRRRGLVLLDVQFMTEHLRRLGAVEIPRSVYERRLAETVHLPVRFVD